MNHDDMKPDAGKFFATVGGAIIMGFILGTIGILAVWLLVKLIGVLPW